MNRERIYAQDDSHSLVIKMSGPKVGEGRLAAADLAEIIRLTQQALKRIGQVLYGQESFGKGRKFKDIEKQCELYVVSWEKGSAVVALELAEPPSQSDIFGHIGEQSLKAFVGGIESIAGVSTKLEALPAGFDTGVLQTCESLGRVLDHGIDGITFHTPNGAVSKQAVYDKPVRQSMRHLLKYPVTVSETFKVGRLEVLNGHGKLAGKLWETGGKKWLCHFREEHFELLAGLWMKNVKLAGQAITEEGKEPIFNVNSIMPLEGGTATGYVAESAAFWESTSLDVLVENQGVAPADNLDQISALWPADDDPDDLLNYIMRERQERRTLLRA